MHNILFFCVSILSHVESALLTSHFEKCTDFTFKNLDEDSFGAEILTSGSDVGILNILFDHSVNVC